MYSSELPGRSFHDALPNSQREVDRYEISNAIGTDGLLSTMHEL